MAADIKQKYGSSSQAITVTLASLASGSMRQSAAIDNSSNLFTDVNITAKIRTGASVTGGYVGVYAAASVDGGTTYGGGASGSDAAYSGDKNTLIYLGTIPVAAASSTYIGNFTLSRAFAPGAIPASWALIFDNQTGQTLDSTSGNFDIKYQGVLGQSV